jgi:hypothetical protein
MLKKDKTINILNQANEEGMVDMAAELFAGLFLRQWEHNKRKEDARSPNHKSCEDRLNSN